MDPVGAIDASGDRCGDGIPVPIEACDDGNTAAGDGCSPTCTLEIQDVGSGSGCSGAAKLQLVATGPDRYGALAGGTLGNVDATIGSCAAPAGPDRILELFLDRATRLHVSVIPVSGFDPSLYLRGQPCIDPGSELVCKNAQAAGSSETISFDLPAGTYFVIVDLENGASNTSFTLELQATRL
jgi:cysteine-rich repeat protein